MTAIGRLRVDPSIMAHPTDGQRLTGQRAVICRFNDRQELTTGQCIPLG